MRTTNPATTVAEGPGSEQLFHQMPTLMISGNVAVCTGQLPADPGLADTMYWQLRKSLRDCPDPGLAYRTFWRLRNTSS